MHEIAIDNKYYQVKHVFTPERVIIDYDGLFAFADLLNGTWDLSGVPARTADEKRVLAQLTATLEQG